MKLCDTCKRPPSERSHTVAGPEGATFDHCSDPIHDLADEAPALEKELGEKRRLLALMDMANKNMSHQAEWWKVQAEAMEILWHQAQGPN